MRKVPVVTGFILTDRGGTRPPAAKAGFAFAGDDPLGHVDNFTRVVPKLPVLEAAAAGDGFLNQLPEWDNVVRRVPLILKLNGKPYPSLAAEALRLAFGATTYIGRAAGANGEKNFGQDTGLTAIRIGPLDGADRRRRAGLAALCAAPSPTAPSPPPTCSPAPSIRRGSPAISCWSGLRLPGSSTICRRPRSSPAVPGVEIHAQLLDEILQGDFLTRPDWAVGAEILFALLVGAGLILVLPRIGALPSAALGGVSVAAALGGVVVRLQIRASADRPGLSLGGVDPRLSGGEPTRLPAHRGAPARDPQRLLALHVAALCRGTRRAPRKARPRRRDADR